MPAVYLFVYYQAGLYADFGINVYYLLAALYGWVRWRKRPAGGGKQSGEPSIQSLFSPRPRLSVIAGSAAGFLAAFLLIAFVLIRFTDSNVPWCDAFTTAASIVAMWLLAHKFVEQWIVWIAVDAVSSFLYDYKDLYFTAALYALYTLIAVFGYLKWWRMMVAQG